MSRSKVTTRAPWYIIRINEHSFLQKAHSTADAVFGAVRRYPDPHFKTGVIVVEFVYKDLLFENNPDITFTAYKRIIEKNNPKNKKQRKGIDWSKTKPNGSDAQIVLKKD
jgi:hypothetical protein